MRRRKVESLGEAVLDIVGMLEERPAGAKVSYWEAVVGSYRDGAFKSDVVEPIEAAIREYVEGIRAGDKRKLWCQTEVGMMEDEDPGNIDIACIEMDLEVGLLSEIIEEAACEAESRRAGSQGRRSRRRSPGWGNRDDRRGEQSPGW